MNHNEYNTDLATRICNAFDAKQWSYRFDAEDGLMSMDFSLPCKLESVYFVVDIQSDKFITHAVSPLAVPTDDPEIMQRMCEFTVCANYGLNIGNFQMDERDGELLFRVAVDCAGGLVPTDEVICNCVLISAKMLTMYADAILEIVFGESQTSVPDLVKKCKFQEVRHMTQALRSLLDPESDGESDAPASGEEEIDACLLEEDEEDAPDESFDET